MENLVKLVEAVKLVSLDDEAVQGVQQPSNVPDSRLWADGTGIDLQTDAKVGTAAISPEGGQALLAHAARTANGFYVVDADRSKK